jgi:hypothetical protein
MGFEVLHGIIGCLWVIGDYISKFKEALVRETGILTEVDTYDWITFLPMANGTGAYNLALWQAEYGQDEDPSGHCTQG